MDKYCKLQSTYNTNMPFRMFLYAAKAYEGYANDPDNNFNIYSDEFQYIPAARFAVFYNGKKGRVLYPTYYSDKVKGKTLKESGVINEKNIAI